MKRTQKPTTRRDLLYLLAQANHNDCRTGNVTSCPGEQSADCDRRGTLFPAREFSSS
jgi:hypothetical protein